MNGDEERLKKDKHFQKISPEKKFVDLCHRQANLCPPKDCALSRHYSRLFSNVDF